MAIQQKIWCDECGEEFPSREAANAHIAKPCMTIKKDDRVEFTYFLLPSVTGTVDRLGPLVKAGEPRIVYINADEQIELPDAAQCHTRYDVFVPVTDVRKIEPAASGGSQVLHKQVYDPGLIF